MARMVDHSTKGDQTNLLPIRSFQTIEVARTKAEIKEQHGKSSVPFAKTQIFPGMECYWVEGP